MGATRVVMADIKRNDGINGESRGHFKLISELRLAPLHQN